MKRLFYLLFVGSVGFACAAEDEEPNPVDPQSIELREGKADHASDLAVYDIRGGTLIVVNGDIAADLWHVMETAHGFQSLSFGSLDYLFGNYVACVTNGRAATCHIVTRTASASDDFLVTVHGRRFASAASELFGALARASGVRPYTVVTASSERFYCEKDAVAVWCGITPATSEPQLTLSFANLEDLGDDYVYEGWLITSEGPVSSGRFSLTGADDQPTFSISSAIAADSSLFVLTIEPRFGDDPGPADTHVLAGAFVGDTAALTVGHPAALGTDFDAAAGGYILETPTTAAVADDYRNGIWFVDPQAGAASLTLPTLPAGWVYEGWVVSSDGPISTGRFASVTGADDDGAGPAAGPDGAPPFPGQDFIAPPRNLVDHTVVISVEPEPDNSAAPFALKPLVDMSAQDVGPGQLQDLGNNAGANPSGTAVLR